MHAVVSPVASRGAVGPARFRIAQHAPHQPPYQPPYQPPAPRLCPQQQRPSVVARSASWDPEDLYKNAPEMTGLIDRKLMGNRAQDDQKQKTVMQKFMDAAKAETQAKRDARVVPEDNYELIAFLLDTEATDMQYEVARCRPLLTDEFFEVLNKQIGMEQLSLEKDEDKLAELELLREYLNEAVETIDNATKAVASAPERLKKLMESPDKKSTLRDMAANGEIDQAFFDLLDQNIDGAEEAGREDVVEFMQKVKVAAAKFMV
mmetsp:Transcript_3511/g.10215  ORF Transcript_3511/g.10215 Transcript_3511/m.10215 type:complete len:262 (-) Transcript_3511:25-810(-)|eukprot:CAMPEP_0182619290 /NCGR_PEP_ID=MMETSP1330-20130603/46029_1 /TAXON_ID=464278 /ORGANISM="Picochlorum sp., Strain RCC944" /LENGTH=261 /DNA_ID=CAMNT_0024839525 /DNA_START=85 /DNA_END=870 /DNA_ORIENTATION=+